MSAFVARPEAGSRGDVPRPCSRALLCTHNSARSQMAEGSSARCRRRVEVASAGTEATRVHPLAIRAMDEVGIDLRGQPPRRSTVRRRSPGTTSSRSATARTSAVPVFPGAPRGSTGASRTPRRRPGGEDERLGGLPAGPRRDRDAAARLGGWLAGGRVRTAERARRGPVAARSRRRSARRFCWPRSSARGSWRARWRAATSRSRCSPTRWPPAPRWWR